MHLCFAKQSETLGAGQALKVIDRFSHRDRAALPDRSPSNPKWPASHCRVGRAERVRGRRTRRRARTATAVGQHLDGTAAAAYFPAGSAIGEDLPVCAAIDIRSGTRKINGTRNLDGTATFSCATERHRIVGAAQFENCY